MSLLSRFLSLFFSELRDVRVAVPRVRVERLTYTDDMTLPVSTTLLQEVLIEECVRGEERDPVHGDYRILVGQPAVDGQPPAPFRRPDHPRPGEVSRRGFLGRFRRSRGPLHLVFDCLQAVLPFGSRR